MKQYQMFELQFVGTEPVSSYVQVDVTATFTVNQGREDAAVTTVKGFYSGNGIYKVRFYPAIAGTYHWKVEGVVSGEGTKECTPSVKKNAGIVRAEDTHFVYDGGAYFKPFGTTIYAMNHQEQNLIDTTMKTLSTAPFNKVRHCIFPKHYEFNHNNPEYYPFSFKDQAKPDVHHPDFEFWDHFEEGIFKLAEMGIQSDLILFHPYDDLDNWGFSQMTQEDNLVYLDYAMRRFSAIPQVWWSMANEYDLCTKKTMEDWYELEDFIYANDPYHHLLSNHQIFEAYDFSREHITHQCMQTTLFYKAEDWMKEFNKPLIYDECCYEGDLENDWGNISGFEMVNRFWMANAEGAYATHGEVFLSDDEILWWAKGGVLKGESTARIAFLKEIMDELPGVLEPHSEPSGFAEYIASQPPERLAEMANSPIAKRFMNKSEFDKLVDETKSKNYMGHIGNDIFLYYFGRHCNRQATIKLPEEYKYQIEVIDAWEMTRKVVLTDVSGKVVVPLAGKEGMAVLAKCMK